MLSKTYLALIVIVLGLTASLEALPKYVIFNSIAPPNTSSPLNKGPYGLSTLISIAREEGYKVTFVGTPDDLAYINSRKVLLLIIAPNYISKEDIDSMLKNLKKFEYVSVLIADEIPGFTNSAALSWYLSKSICNSYVIFPDNIQSPLFSRALAVVSYPKGGGMYSLLTAYVDRVKVYSVKNRHYSEIFLKYSSLRKLPVTISSSSESNEITVTLLGLVTNIGNMTAGSQGWIPYMVSCYNRESKRRIVVIGDSSIFINEAINRSSIYMSNFNSLLNFLTNGDKGYNIVFVMDLYVPPAYRLKYKFLPSIFLTWVATAYRNVENVLLENMKSKKPILIIVLSLALLLLPLSFVPEHLRTTLEHKKKIKRKQDLRELCSEMEKLYQLQELLGYKRNIKMPSSCVLTKKKPLYTFLRILGVEAFLRRRVETQVRRYGFSTEEE